MGETIAQNRRATHEYTVEETFEAGIVLRGTEIKSIRAHKVSLADAYARIDRDEAWIVGLHIAPWENADVRFNHEPKRARKLLLHREEIDELLGKTKAKGLTLVPLAAVHQRPGQGEGAASGSPGASRRGTAAGRSPSATRSARSSAPWPTPEATVGADAARADDPGGRRPRGGRAGAGHRRRRARRPGRDDVREDAPPRRATATSCARLMLREPRGYPALCANVVLPPTHPDADAGYVIMEQVEYPGMSGTNTICVATVLLETGMLPMTEPITELALEAPAGPDPDPGDVRGRQGHRRDVPQRAGVRDPPRRPDRGPAAGHGRRSTSPTAACST